MNNASSKNATNLDLQETAKSKKGKSKKRRSYKVKFYHLWRTYIFDRRVFAVIY